MIEFFNEILNSFKLFVNCYFTDLAFAEGVSIGWLLLAISVFAIVINFLYRRMK